MYSAYLQFVMHKTAQWVQSQTTPAVWNRLHRLSLLVICKAEGFEVELLIGVACLSVQ